ncbi:hypothetical protein M9458_021483, partial [Cirrhinus mrigala]
PASAQPRVVARGCNVSAYVRNLDVPLQSFHYDVTYGNRPMEKATTLRPRYARAQ